MATSVREVMTPDPRTVERDAPAVEAAKIMRDEDVGAVVVTEGDKTFGLLTDRDIVVRAVADGRGDDAKAGEIATTDLATLSPDDSIDDAIRLLREKHIRRVLVTDGDKPAGIVSIGDLALERDKDSALAEISAAAPNN